ncbi:MAG: hypothetical protein ACUZ8H_05560 [Candidatus Anammoxibacter sp.]
MVLSTPQALFGVHSVTAYNPDTRIPFGIAKVVGSVSFANSGEIIDLFGGSNLYPFKKEPGVIDASGTFVFREYPDWAFEAFLGKAATTNAAEASGSVDTIANRNGTSVVASTGIASIGVKGGSEADVKSTRYVVKAASATTVDVYAMSDADFGVGTDLTFVDDTLKITASPLTITQSGAVDIPNTGLELTGDSGVIAMVTGDTASFISRAINDGSTEVIIGSTTQTFIDVGLVFHGQRQKDGTIMSIDIFRALGIGIPFNFSEKAFSDVEIPWGAQFDSTRNGVFDYIRVKDAN